MKQDHLHFASNKSDLEFFIDYLDIVSSNKLTIPNQDAIDHSERFIKENYKYDFLL